MPDQSTTDPTPERKWRWPWITNEQMEDRILACLAGLPPMCWHKICRRHGKCVAKEFSCLHEHEGYVERHIALERRKRGLPEEDDWEEENE